VVSLPGETCSGKRNLEAVGVEELLEDWTSEPVVPIVMERVKEPGTVMQTEPVVTGFGAVGANWVTSGSECRLAMILMFHLHLRRQRMNHRLMNLRPRRNRRLTSLPLPPPPPPDEPPPLVGGSYDDIGDRDSFRGGLGVPGGISGRSRESVSAILRFRRYSCA